jgi:putative ABC transport system permease protein
VPAAGETRTAVLGEAAAAALGKNLTDEIELFGQPFKIVGIAGYASGVNRSAVLVPLAGLQEVSYRPRQVTIAHVDAADADDRTALARVRDAIEATGSVVAAPPAEVIEHDRNFIVLAALALAAAAFAALMSALNVVTALVMSAQERTREIGIFSAIGWSAGRIVQSVVIEGLLLWAIGCALGVGLAFAIAAAVPYIPVVGHLIAFQPGAALIVPVLAAALVLCLLGALVPAWRVARMLPAEALRR